MIFHKTLPQHYGLSVRSQDVLSVRNCKNLFMQQMFIEELFWAFGYRKESWGVVPSKKMCSCVRKIKPTYEKLWMLLCPQRHCMGRNVFLSFTHRTDETIIPWISTTFYC